MLNGLKEKIRVDGQRSLNDQFYILKGGVSSELDNESYVQQQKEKGLSRSSSLDSDEENCDNDLSSKISSISSVEKVAESRNVGKVIGG
ncbi:hypothetical protein [Wolbachia endosymbiont of Drosophila tsacasi]|uniref:hypothetical protein n=1 Tax=Wolbachia endosymbiont of Drosophila tsacasi TaxID=3002579 RepID=UPI0023A99EAA|nr:hypothetical protein [Wolbachia endosymbiont of Drosophila tsacasi]MDE5062389.1 hypothetical protein [Wolbachia endosymbiont of Drosophila tsacasi]